MVNHRAKQKIKSSNNNTDDDDVEMTVHLGHHLLLTKERKRVKCNREILQGLCEHHYYIIQCPTEYSITNEAKKKRRRKIQDIRKNIDVSKLVNVKRKKKRLLVISEFVELEENIKTELNVDLQINKMKTTLNVNTKVDLMNNNKKVFTSLLRSIFVRVFRKSNKNTFKYEQVEI